MTTLHFTGILLLALLLPTTLFASSVRMLFTDEELTEMGVRIEPGDIESERAIA